MKDTQIGFINAFFSAAKGTIHDNELCNSKKEKEKIKLFFPDRFLTAVIRKLRWPSGGTPLIGFDGMLLLGDGLGLSDSSSLLWWRELL